LPLRHQPGLLAEIEADLDRDIDPDEPIEIPEVAVEPAMA
jgi:hypothetical protein